MKVLDYEGLSEVVNNIKTSINSSANSTLTNSKKYTDDNVELIKNQILDPDNYGESSVKEGGVIVVDFKRGYINSSTGEEEAGEDYLITSFIPVENDKFTLYSDAPVDSTIRIYVYDDEQNWISTANENSGYYRIGNGENADITSKAKYIRCRINSSADSGTLTVTFDDTIVVNHETHQKIYFNNGYNMESSLIEDNLYQLQVNAEENEFNIFTIAAPKNNASEATLSLMVNDEEKTQFVDLSCMKYSEDEDGYFCTILQSRGDTPLPRYILGFNDGKGAGRVRKLEIEPDAIPMKFLSNGIKVRKDNAYDNNWTDDNSVIVNLAELAEKVPNWDSAEANAKAYTDTKLASKSDTSHTHNYLSLDGGTLTGDVLSTTSDSSERHFQVSNSLHNGHLCTSTNGNFGLFSNTLGKWVVKCDTSGNTSLYGNADTASNAYSSTFAIPNNGSDNPEGGELCLKNQDGTFWNIDSCSNNFRIFDSNGGVHLYLDKSNSGNNYVIGKATSATNSDKLDGYHADSFAKLTGANFTGAVKIVSPDLNGTYNGLLIGDDCYIGDCNISNTIGLMGQTDNNIAYVKFGKGGKSLGYNGTTLVYDGSMVYTGKNITYGTSALTAGSSKLSTGNIYLQYE